MKKLIITLSTLSISFSAVASPHEATGREQIQNLTSCEQEIVSTMDQTRKNLWMNSASGVAVGAMAGSAVYGIGYTVGVSASSSNAAFGGAIADPATTGLILSAVGTGVVVAAIVVGANYYENRQFVDSSESLMQLFKEVRNNGMGPQLDARVIAIQKTMAQLKAKAGKKMTQVTGQDFNDQSTTDEQVRSTVMQTVTQFGTSKAVTCTDPAQVSQRIDKIVLQTLIEKFNPSLKAVVR